MCIAQDLRRREASKPLPVNAHHGFTQLKKSLHVTSLNHPVLRRENSFDTITTDSSHTSGGSSSHEAHNDVVNETIQEENHGAALSVASMHRDGQFSDRCTTPPPVTHCNWLLEPPSTPHPLREVLKIDFDDARITQLYLPFL